MKKHVFEVFSYLQNKKHVFEKGIFSCLKNQKHVFEAFSSLQNKKKHVFLSVL